MTAYEDIVQALQLPEAYPDRPRAIEHLQTHVSHLFLTPDHVYKVKKPVDFGFLDFTTLEKRRHFCHRELELNRRLSPDVYLSVREVRQTPDGAIGLTGAGVVVEHALQMRRLPADTAMDGLLSKNALTEEMVRLLGRLVGEFHTKAASNEATAKYGTRAAVQALVEQNFQQMRGYIKRTLSPSKYRKLQDYSLSFLQDQASLFERRVTGGFVRDCHGDLHSAQVFFTREGVRIIDCIEYNEEFRNCDMAADMAFMAMDLDQAGRHDLSRAFVEAWLETTGDREALELLDFYKVYRACVRGKVESFRLDDPEIPLPEKEQATRRARAYFNLAHFYIHKSQQPRLLLCMGLTGTGKSTVARYVAGDGGMIVISTDAVRKQLAGIAPQERHYDAFESGLYTPEFTERTYQEMMRQAGQHLEEGASVVLDGTFARRHERELAQALADRLGAELWVLECASSEQDIKERLNRREQRGSSLSDGRWEIYQQQRQSFEPPDEVSSSRHVLVDTSAGSVSDSVQFALRRLGLAHV